MTTIPGLSCLPLGELARLTPHDRDRYVAAVFRSGRKSAGADHLEAITRRNATEINALRDTVADLRRELASIHDRYAAAAATPEPDPPGEVHARRLTLADL